MSKYDLVSLGRSRTSPPVVGVPSLVVPGDAIPHEYRARWRIVETSLWGVRHFDVLGPALLSITGHADRLRIHSLFAYVNEMPTKTGVSFTWEGAWEFDRVSGTGSVKLGKDGRLKGRIKIKEGDASTFVAETTKEPEKPIEEPRRYRDKWRR